MESDFKKKLSVIIPLYNVEAYAAKAAASIARQAFDGLEVVVVDDGSSDNSFDVCVNGLPGLDIISIRQKNSGLSSARNTGMKAASGEYILFLDSDDFLMPDAFKNILFALEEKKPDVLFGRYLRWTPSTGLIKGKKYDFNPPENPKKRVDYILCELPEPSWNAWRYIFRRDLLEKYKLSFVSGVYCEDVKWSLELLEAAESIAYLSEPFYVYYDKRPGSIMSEKSVKRLIDLNSTAKELLELYRDKDRDILCAELIGQSFYYISEYCSFKFKKADRKRIYECYKNILPYYYLSKKLSHKIARKIKNPVCFYLFSVMLLILKRAWRVLRKFKTRGEK